MADFVYTIGLSGLMDGTIDLNTHDIRVRLVMTNTTADTDDGTGRDAATIAAITMDEMDGASYPTGGGVLAAESVAPDTANNRGVFDANDLTFTTLGQGTRKVQAAIVVKSIGQDGTDIPIYYIESGFDPPTGVDANGGDFKITWHANGIAYSS